MLHIVMHVLFAIIYTRAAELSRLSLCIVHTYAYVHVYFERIIFHIGCSITVVGYLLSRLICPIYKECFMEKQVYDAHANHGFIIERKSHT